MFYFLLLHANFKLPSPLASKDSYFFKNDTQFLAM